MTGRPAGPGTFDARVVGGGGEAGPAIVRLQAGRLVVERAGGAALRDIHLDDVEEVRRDGPRVTLALAHGAMLALESDRADALDAAVAEACCAIPELTRGLHSLGSSRARSNAAGQREFLAPLLDARRRAEEAVGRSAVVAAFDLDRVSTGLDKYVAALTARTSDARPAARRAVAAAADDAVAPLREAIEAVRAAAPAAAQPPADARVASWRRWRAALQALFAAADRSWLALSSGAAAPPRRLD